MRAKKLIVLLACALCALALAGAGSLAYFTASDKISHGFLVATSEGGEVDPDAVFSIALTQIDDAGGQSQQGITYQDMKPGSKMPLDPKVKNTGEHSAWLRVTATFTQTQAWERVLATHNMDAKTALPALLDVNARTWELGEVNTDAAADTMTFTYYYAPELKPGEVARLMENLTLDGAFTSDEVDMLSGFQLKFRAEAIQRENTGASAREAFANYWN